MNPCVISGLKVTNQRASPSDIEAASCVESKARLKDLMAAEPVTEAFVLQTCIRVELYVVTETPIAGRRVLSDVDLRVADSLAEAMDHEGSLRHLLRVAAGLESFVTGEDTVLGQVRDAFEEAKSAGATGPILEMALLKAIHLGGRARSETVMNDGPTSIAGAAVALAQRTCELDESTVLVIGAGEMGTHAAQAISVRGAMELLLANRTRRRAERLASRLKSPVHVVDFDALPTVLSDTDIVVSATGSREPIITPAMLETADQTDIVDIAQPRDVAPKASSLENVTVYDLERLKSVTETARKQRNSAIERVETMIDEAMMDLLDRYKRNRIDGVIAGMYKGAERIKRQQLDKALPKLERYGELTHEQGEVIEALAEALVSQLLAAPTSALREAAANDDWTTIETAIRFFNPTPDEGGQGALEPVNLPDSMGTAGITQASDTQDDD